jgi:hypothetical protein
LILLKPKLETEFSHLPFSQLQKISVNDTSRYKLILRGLKRKLIIKKRNPLIDRGHFVCRCGVRTTTCLLGVKPSLKFIKPLDENIEALGETDYEFVVVWSSRSGQQSAGRGRFLCSRIGSGNTHATQYVLSTKQIDIRADLAPFTLAIQD